MTPGVMHSLFPRDDHKLPGVAVAVVTNNHDPEGLGRVKVRFPWLNDDDESFWARVASPMAGPGRGFFFLPEVDDEVLVAFEHGEMGHAYVIGALWNGKDKPPVSNSDGKNDLRTIKSRSGHVLRFNDSDGDAKIEIADKSGNNKIVISTADNTVKISADSDIVIESSTGKIKLSGMGIEIESKTDVKVKAQTSVDVQATAEANIKGAMVNLN